MQQLPALLSHALYFLLSECPSSLAAHYWALLGISGARKSFFGLCGPGRLSPHFPLFVVHGRRGWTRDALEGGEPPPPGRPAHAQPLSP